MIAWIQQLIGTEGTDGHVSLVAKADHVELTSTHLVIGLKVDFLNHTEVPISIKELQVRVYMNGRRQEPLRFYPLERYARVLTQRAILKKPLKAFSLPSGEIFSENYRFISQELRDIPAGNYAVDVFLKDINDVSYTNRIKLHLESKIKYRSSEEWEQD